MISSQKSGITGQAGREQHMTRADARAESRKSGERAAGMRRRPTVDHQERSRLGRSASHRMFRHSRGTADGRPVPAPLKEMVEAG